MRRKTRLQIVQQIRMIFSHAGHMQQRSLRQMIAIEPVQHGHIKRRGGSALFVKSMHVKITMIITLISQTMDQPRIAVEGKDYRLVSGKQVLKLRLAFAMRMLLITLQRHQINNVYYAHAQRRQ